MSDSASNIDRLLAASEKVLGLKLCLHASVLPVPSRWRFHGGCFCMAMKRKARNTCLAFDGDEVHAALQGHPGGRIHTCPQGCMELAVPLTIEGRFAGVLFAGQIWAGRGHPPHDDLIVRPGREWMEMRLVVLGALALQLAGLFCREGKEDRRTAQVYVFLEANLGVPLCLEDLASHLSLSPSRTRHLVRERFGTTFTDLVQRTKLAEAAHRLLITEAAIGEVARRVGYDDQG